MSGKAIYKVWKGVLTYVLSVLLIVEPMVVYANTGAPAAAPSSTPTSAPATPAPSTTPNFGNPKVVKGTPAPNRFGPAGVVANKVVQGSLTKRNGRTSMDPEKYRRLQRKLQMEEERVFNETVKKGSERRGKLKQASGMEVIPTYLNYIVLFAFGLVGIGMAKNCRAVLPWTGIPPSIIAFISAAVLYVVGEVYASMAFKDAGEKILKVDHDKGQSSEDGFNNQVKDLEKAKKIIAKNKQTVMVKYAIQTAATLAMLTAGILATVEATRQEGYFALADKAITAGQLPIAPCTSNAASAECKAACDQAQREAIECKTAMSYSLGWAEELAGNSCLGSIAVADAMKTATTDNFKRYSDLVKESETSKAKSDANWQVTAGTGLVGVASAAAGKALSKSLEPYNALGSNEVITEIALLDTFATTQKALVTRCPGGASGIEPATQPNHVPLIAAPTARLSFSVLCAGQDSADVGSVLEDIFRSNDNLLKNVISQNPIKKIIAGDESFTHPTHEFLMYGHLIDLGKTGKHGFELLARKENSLNSFLVEEINQKHRGNDSFSQTMRMLKNKFLIPEANAFIGGLGGLGGGDGKGNMFLMGGAGLYGLLAMLDATEGLLSIFASPSSRQIFFYVFTGFMAVGASSSLFAAQRLAKNEKQIQGVINYMDSIVTKNDLFYGGQDFSYKGKDGSFENKVIQIDRAVNEVKPTALSPQLKGRRCGQLSSDPRKIQSRECQQCEQNPELCSTGNKNVINSAFVKNNQIPPTLSNIPVQAESASAKFLLGQERNGFKQVQALNANEAILKETSKNADAKFNEARKKAGFAAIDLNKQRSEIFDNINANVNNSLANKGLLTPDGKLKGLDKEGLAASLSAAEKEKKAQEEKDKGSGDYGVAFKAGEALKGFNKNQNPKRRRRKGKKKKGVGGNYTSGTEVSTVDEYGLESNEVFNYSKGSQINKNDSVSLFQLVSARYIKTAIPIFAEEIAVEASAPVDENEYEDEETDEETIE